MKRRGSFGNKRVTKRARYVPPAPPQAAYRKRRQYLDNTEYKVTDVDVATSATATLAATDLLTNLTRGDGGINNFDGIRIFPKGLQVKIIYRLPTTTTVPTMSCRLMLIQWFDAGVPAPAGVLQITGVAGATCTSATLLTNRDNIRVLWDKLFVLQSPYPAGAGMQTSVIFKKYIKGARMEPISFASGTATPQKGGIYLFTFADTATATDYPIVDGYTRITFTD